MISPADLEERIKARISALEKSGFVDRLGKKDPTLWSDDAEVKEFISQFLGWVDVAERSLEQVYNFKGFARELQESGFMDAVVLGMGGSSLSALMFSQMFPQAPGLTLHVLDSTVPGDVARILDSVNLDRTVFIVASKSGTTVEPDRKSVV